MNNDDWLGDALGAYATCEPSHDLRARIVAAAPRERRAGRLERWLAAAALGVGLATSCAAGVAAGFSLAPHSVTRMFVPASASPDVSSLADPADDPADG
jgi:hypothetical protein